MQLKQIFFSMSVPSTEDCWVDGYLHAGNCGSLHEVAFHQDKDIIIPVRVIHGITGQMEPIQHVNGSILDVVPKLASFFDCDPEALSEVLAIALDPIGFSEKIGSKGRFYLRPGEDYCSEINLEDIELTDSERENLRLVFHAVVTGKLDYDEFDEDAQFASLYIP